MRRTCRWLGFATLMAISVVEFSGCQSRSLVSSLRIPGKKARPEETAESTARVRQDRADELLAEARQYEREGDFPNATRAYREYLNSGGRPIKEEAPGPPDAVAEIEKQHRDRAASYHSDDGHDARDEVAEDKEQNHFIRKSRKAKLLDNKRAATDRSADTSIEDPWATTPEDTTPVERVAQADSDNSGEPRTHTERQEVDLAASEEASAAHQDDQFDASEKDGAENRIPDDAIAEMMDLKEDAIDWGDEPSESSASPDEQHFSSSDHQLANSLEPNSSDRSINTDAFEEPQWDESPHSANDHQLALSEAAIDPSSADEAYDRLIDKQSKFAAECRHCDPWVYAQVMKLESPASEVRTEGLVNLADLGPNAREASSAIHALMEDPDPTVRANAAWAAWRVEESAKESVEALVPLLSSTNVEVIELACFALGDIGAEAEPAVQNLEELQTHSEGTTRLQAAEALIRIRGEHVESLQVLVDALKSRDGGERWLAAVALGRCQGAYSADIVTALTEALQDVDTEVRCAAVLSLGAFGQEAAAATEELRRVAHSDEAQVREAAVAALGCLENAP